MAHRSKRSQPRSNIDDFNDLESEMRAPRARHPLVDVVRPPVSLRDEDRRKWAPGLPGRPSREVPREAVGRPARIVHRTALVKRPVGVTGNWFTAPKSSFRLASREAFGFADPRKTLLCLKRKVRRQVMFAFKQTRAGARSPRKRNEFSDVRC